MQVNDPALLGLLSEDCHSGGEYSRDGLQQLWSESEE